MTLRKHCKYTPKGYNSLRFLNRLLDSGNSVSNSLGKRLALSILWKFTKAVLFFVEGIFKPGVQNVGATGECVCLASRRHTIA